MGSANRLLVVDWPAADLAQLEARASRGIVAVRHEAGAIRILAQCSPPGSYAYTPVTLKKEDESIESLEELRIKVPLGFGKLAAALERGQSVKVSTYVVGSREATGLQPDAARWTGDCEGATHVITGFAVGASEFFAVDRAEHGAGAGVQGVGADAATSSTARRLTRNGDPSAIPRDTSELESPPKGADAIVALSLRPIREPASSSQATWGYVTGSVGLVALGVGAVTGWMAKGERDVVLDRCSDDHWCDQEGYDAAQSGKTLSTISTVGFGLGAAGVLAGSWLLLSAPPSGPAPDRGTALPTRGGLQLRGSF